MCFSATASFTASGVLVAIGAVAIKKSTTPAQRVLSSVPLIFAAQQFTEGVLWLGIRHSELAAVKEPAIYIFMLFAQVVWPIMIPLSVLLLEQNRKKRKWMKILLGSGLIASCYLFYVIVYYGVHIDADCCHINYRQDLPYFAMKYGGIFYLAPIIVSPAISSIKRLRFLGVVVVISYALSQLFYSEYLTSVWCFFAALISVIILLTIMHMNKNKAEVSNK